MSPSVFCQDAQAVFLPHPRKCDVVSHPVMARESGNATDLEGPRSEKISWMGISLRLFPLPKPTQSSTRPSVGKKRMARTTISLSTVLTYDVWCPCPDACARWRYILVSAPEWLHGSRADTSHGLLEITLSHLLLRRSFPPRACLTISSLRKENNSFLFSSFLRNPLFHSWFGIWVWPSQS